MQENKEIVTILRSAVGSLAAIGFLKFLTENGFRVIGTDITDLSVGKLFVDKFYKVPSAIEIEKVIKRYKNIIKRENVRWIISGPEQEILTLMKEKEYFKNLGAEILHPPLETLEIVTDKLALFTFFSQKKIRQPKTYVLRYANFLNGKFILKPRKGRGSSEILFSEREKLSSLKNIFSKNDYIVQEFIHGEEFTVDVLYDLDGNLLNIVPRRRLKTDSGISVIGETVKDKNLIEIVLEISSYLKFIGGNCFQFIKDKDDNYYLTDINPRFGGGFILSLKASKSFRKNLINLLKNKHSLLTKLSFDFVEMKMYRYYDEFFKI